MILVHFFILKACKCSRVHPVFMVFSICKGFRNLRMDSPPHLPFSCLCVIEQKAILTFFLLLPKWHRACSWAYLIQHLSWFLCLLAKRSLLVRELRNLPASQRINMLKAMPLSLAEKCKLRLVPLDYISSISSSPVWGIPCGIEMEIVPKWQLCFFIILSRNAYFAMMSLFL